MKKFSVITLFMLCVFLIFTGCGKPNNTVESNGMLRIQNELRSISKSNDIDKIKAVANNLKAMANNVNNPDEIKKHAAFCYYYIKSIILLKNSSRPIDAMTIQANFYELTKAEALLSTIPKKGFKKIENIDNELQKVKSACERLEQYLTQNN